MTVSVRQRWCPPLLLLECELPLLELPLLECELELPEDEPPECEGGLYERAGGL
jgi:hypothetical protein